MFERGKKARAHRDVLARGLERHSGFKGNPYALASFIVKKGGKSHDKSAVEKEFKEQKHSRRMNLKGYHQSKGNPKKFHK